MESATTAEINDAQSTHSIPAMRPSLRPPTWSHLQRQPSWNSRRSSWDLPSPEPPADASKAEATFADYTPLYGYLLLLFTHLMFVGSLYALIVSKWMPETGNKILDWIQQDDYYCYLVPVTLPVALATVIWNWMGMKFFRHN